MPLHFIDMKCHIKQLKNGKSHKTCNRTQSVLHHTMPLVIVALKSKCTHMHTYQCTNKSNFKKPGVPTTDWHTPGLKYGKWTMFAKYQINTYVCCNLNDIVSKKIYEAFVLPIMYGCACVLLEIFIIGPIIIFIINLIGEYYMYLRHTYNSVTVLKL